MFRDQKNSRRGSLQQLFVRDELREIREEADLFARIIIVR